MDVVSPRSLDEALRVKAEHPGALPVQGGTDVLVELNFDRRRPEVLLNLNEVPELRGWSRENGTLRLASGLTYSEIMGGPVGEGLAALRGAARWAGRGGRSGGRPGQWGPPRPAPAGPSAGPSGPPRRPGTRCRRCSSR